MQAITESVFLQALAQSLVASIWQMALLWLACITLIKAFSLSPAQKFRLAFMAQLGGLVLFVYTLLNAWLDPAAGELVASTSLFYLNTVLRVCLPYVAIAYLAVLAVKLNKVLFMYIASKRLRHRNLIKIGVEQRLFVQRMTETLSIHKKISIYLSEKISCPLTLGFFKPVILIPLAAVNQLTPQQMEAVILHELAHIKRADYLLYIVQNIIDKLFFFNIFSRMLSNLIERERENACDDWVVQFRYNSMHYAEALLKLGRLKAQPVLAMALAGKKEHLLLARIKRLLHKQPDAAVPNLGSAALGFSSIAVVGSICLLASAKPVAEPTAINASLIPAGKVIPAATITPKSAANSNVRAAVYTITTPARETAECQVCNDEQQPVDAEKAASAVAEAAVHTLMAEKEKLAAEVALQQAQQDYLVLARQQLDSLQLSLPKIEAAVDAQVIVTPEMASQARSYQNFRQIEQMLAASGNSIKVTESAATSNAYQKELTIESTDENGNIHVYKVVISLYQ